MWLFDINVLHWLLRSELGELSLVDFLALPGSQHPLPLMSFAIIPLLTERSADQEEVIKQLLSWTVLQAVSTYLARWAKLFIEHVRDHVRHVRPDAGDADGWHILLIQVCVFVKCGLPEGRHVCCAVLLLVEVQCML